MHAGIERVGFERFVIRLHVEFSHPVERDHIEFVDRFVEFFGVARGG